MGYEKSATELAQENMRGSAEAEKREVLQREINATKVVIESLQEAIEGRRSWELENVMDTRTHFLSSLCYAEGEAQTHLIELKRKLKALS